MLNTTVTPRFPGEMVSRTRSAIRLCTVTVTVLHEPAAVSEPAAGETVTVAFGLVIRKLTGPPTALTMNVPLAALPLSADSTSCFGVTCSVPGVGGGDDEGEGEDDGDEDGDLDGDGEDRAGREECGVAGGVEWPAGGPAVGGADVLGVPEAGVGLGLGDDRPPPAAPAGAPDVAKVAPPRATVDAGVRCVPPATSSAVIPAATTATATAATPAAARGCRRT